MGGYHYKGNYRNVKIQKDYVFTMDKSILGQLTVSSIAKSKAKTPTVDSVDSSLEGMRNSLQKMVNFKKGDIVHVISKESHGDMTNDSGGQSLTFKDKEGNLFRVQVDYRGFVPFFKEVSESTKLDDSIKAKDSLFLIETKDFKLNITKEHLIALVLIVGGYFAYKKFSK